MAKIREFRPGNIVYSTRIIFDSRNGDIPAFTRGKVLKVVDGHAPDRYENEYEMYDRQTVRDKRAHTQLLKVQIGSRIEYHISGAYFVKAGSGPLRPSEMDDYRQRTSVLAVEHSQWVLTPAEIATIQAKA